MTNIEKQQTMQERAAAVAAACGGMPTELPFVPSLKIAQLTSGVTKSGDCAAGDLFFNQKQSLGPKTPGLIYNYQLHALRLERKQKVAESYNVQYGEPGPDGIKPIIGDETFVEIMNGKDNAKAGVIHLWGPEILVFLPAIDQFAILFLNKKTTRRYWNEFLNPRWFNPDKPELVELYTDRVAPTGTDYEWWEPHCRLLEEVPEGFALPNPKRVESAHKKFLTKAEAEQAEDGETPPER